MRAPRSWMVYPQADFQTAHNCATAPHSANYGLWSVIGNRNQTVFCRKNHFTAVLQPHEIRGGDGDRCWHRPQDPQSDLSGSCGIFADKIIAEAENTGVAASSEMVPTEVSRDQVSRDQASRDKVHRDEAHRHKVGQSKIRRAKNRRKRPEAPRYRRASRLGAEHHAELFAADRGGQESNQDRARIRIGIGVDGEVLSCSHLGTVRVCCKARDAFV